MEAFGRVVRRAMAVATFSVVAAVVPLAAAAAPAPTAVLRRGGGNVSPRLEQLASTAGLTTSAAAQGQALGLPADGAGSLLRRGDGALVVDARLAEVDEATVAALTRAGATVIARSVPDHLVTLSLAPNDIDAVAAVGSVEWLEEVLTPEVHRIDGEGLASASRSGGMEASASCSSRVVSEGDAHLGAATARSTYGVDGTGIKIGVLSDSFDDLGGAATDVANGELPGVGNPCGHTTPVVVQSELASGGTDEARAMAQAVHDLAPGATILVASAFNGDVDFANQIRNLAAAGAKVIVDDITYFNEPVYQDGIIAKAVADVTAAGVTYLSSASNSNVTLGGKEVASYEAPAYRPTACPGSITSSYGDADCHDWDPSAGTDAGDLLTVSNGGQLQIKLGYNEPQYGISTDLDLFLLDSSTGAVVASSLIDNPNSSEQAYELLSYTNSSGATKTYRLVIGRYESTTTPRLKVIFQRASGLTSVQWSATSSGDVVGPSSYGHNMMRGAGSIAAIRYDTTSAPESFSARGPATYCWNPVSGTSPASSLATCEDHTIDVTATDGAANSFFGSSSSGVWRFYGTSQAAPHAAAIAVLQVQARPCRTPSEILAAQRASGIPIGSYGVNAVGGGRLDASAAIAGLAPCLVLPGAPTGVSANPGDGSVSLTWTAPTSAGSSPITGYRVTPHLGGAAQAPRTFASTATSQAITGLTNGTAYTFTVAATSAAGTGADSTASAPVTPRTVPSPPTSVTGVAGDGQVLVSWAEPTSDGGAAITGYTVTPYIGPTAQTAHTFASTATTQAVTGLANGTAYTFTVRATNAAGDGPASPASPSVTPEAPPDPWAPFDSWGDMVDRLYLDVLGRGPSSFERAVWIAQLDGASSTPGDIVATLRVDPDNLTNVDPVARLYRAYFLRNPDKGGLAYWIRQRRVNQKRLNPISSTFAASSEFQRRYGALSNRAFVELIYRNVLDRPGETSGVDFWTSRLDRKVNTRGQVMTGFSESSEYERKQASEVEVAIQYLLVLGSGPDGATFDDLVARLDAGTLTPAGLADAIIASPAYAEEISATAGTVG